MATKVKDVNAAAWAIPELDGARNESVSLANMDRDRSSTRAGFDGSAANRFNDNHFADASLSDISSIIQANRSTLVKRCCYEYRNNPYAKAMVTSWSNEIIGTGPTLQMQTDNARFNSRLEELWTHWAKHCDASEKQNLAGMLRTGMAALPQFGDDFTTYRTARAGSRAAGDYDIQLRLLEINPQRIASPLYQPTGNNTDGIELDPDTGAPVRYMVYDGHPNSTAVRVLLKAQPVAAEDMVHIYLTDEPGQYRGFPMMAPVLTLMADLRRYTKAVVSAAEQAANISGVIYTTLTNVSETAKAMEEIEIARNTLLTMPAGYEAKAFESKHPMSTYKDFKGELIGEIGRAFMMPFIVASGNAQGYNYSSGRLDLQDWWKSVTIVQDLVGQRKLDKILSRFVQEAILINRVKPGYLPGFTKKIQELGIWNLPHQWNWPGHEHVDPQKEANAQGIRIQNRTTTLAAEYAKQGKDWEREVEQIAREQKKLDELGLTPTDAMPIEPDNSEDE